MDDEVKEVSKEQQIADLKKRLDILGNVVQDLETKNRILANEKKTLLIEKSQWMTEKIQQKIIVQNALNRANTMNNKYLEENDELKNEIRKLKERIKRGDND